MATVERVSRYGGSSAMFSHQAPTGTRTEGTRHAAAVVGSFLSPQLPGQDSKINATHKLDYDGALT